MTKKQKQSGKSNINKCIEGTEVWSIIDSLSNYNMNTHKKLKKSDFTAGNILYHTLNLCEGTFKIHNTNKELLAEAEGLKEKDVLPFLSLYFIDTKVALVEESFEEQK